MVCDRPWKFSYLAEECYVIPTRERVLVLISRSVDRYKKTNEIQKYVAVARANRNNARCRVVVDTPVLEIRESHLKKIIHCAK